MNNFKWPNFFFNLLFAFVVKLDLVLDHINFFSSSSSKAHHDDSGG
jgi:hypothetical protein